MLEQIKKYQYRLQNNFKTTYRRYLYDEIEFDDKMVGLFGARGVGKTTLLFQRLLELHSLGKNVLYISLDYPFLSGVDIVELVESFVDEGGEYLLLDEVHRFENFAANLKTIYDLFDLKVIFTSSSAASILNAKSDLSRRVSLYGLHGFSFREFLELRLGVKLRRFTLVELFDHHIDLANEVFGVCDIDILELFQTYLKNGYYPFYFDKKSSYYQTLLNSINLTLDIDLTSLGLVEQKYTYKLKKLLEVICESKPFEVNYTKIASNAEISRVKLYDYISYLHDAQMLLLIEESAKGVKKIQKPAKIYLHNTNLLCAYCDGADIGTIRETFFANQLSLKHRLNIAKSGDFLVDGKYIVEIGGKNKSFEQIKEEHSYVASADMAIGRGNKIPLWMFGLLY